MGNLQQVGWRCIECGRLDPNSNQPCAEHADVEPVYRDVETAEHPSVRWRIRCFQCNATPFHATREKSVADSWRVDHKKISPDHDVALICITQD